MSEKRVLETATLAELLNEAGGLLQEAGVPDAKLDAWLLMEYCFSITREAYYLRRNQAAGSLAERYRELIKERAQRVPLQYLTGVQWFMGLEFEVNPHVLIPRQDTETLVETVLSRFREQKGASVLDVCTGSGCIAVSLAHYGCFSRVDASDISADALQTAAANARKNGAKVRFLESDLLEQVDSRYDVIVSNPPYIEEKVIEELEPEVKDHEPRLALCGGRDGLDFYRRLLQSAPSHLRAGGAVFVEIGYDQWESVSRLFMEHGFAQPQLVRDLAGLDRVVWAMYQSSQAFDPNIMKLQ